jgi:hypothetical protein
MGGGLEGGGGGGGGGGGRGAPATMRSHGCLGRCNPYPYIAIFATEQAPRNRLTGGYRNVNFVRSPVQIRYLARGVSSGVRASDCSLFFLFFFASANLRLCMRREGESEKSTAGRVGPGGSDDGRSQEWQPTPPLQLPPTPLRSTLRLVDACRTTCAAACVVCIWIAEGE